jgi:hypothetical protein
MKNITLSEAIKSLYPEAQFIIVNDNFDDIQWLEFSLDEKPTKETIDAEISRLQAEYDAKEYQRLRAPEYPDLKELADALYWNSRGDVTKLEFYYEKCEAIKSKYPKTP